MMRGGSTLRKRIFSTEPADKDNHEVGKILIDQVTNEDPRNYKNVGVVLIKSVLQHYWPSCKGRMLLDGVRNTHPYHYKLGFRVTDPEEQYKNETFARIARSGTKVKRDMGAVYMHLPDEAQALWKQEIDANPIRFPDDHHEKKA